MNTITSEIVIHEAPDENQIIDLVLDGLNSPHSKVAYRRALVDFLAWHEQQGRPGLSKMVVQTYRTHLQSIGLASSSTNQRLAAIRKLAQEAADNGFLDQLAANGISRVKGVKRLGVRSGNWLTKDQAQSLVNSPDISTPRGLRDRAILAVMIGGGLRRSEVAALMVENIQLRDSRWVIVDLIGKGGRVRSVPIPAWVRMAVNAWLDEAGITSGFVFLAISRKSNEHLTSQAVHNVVKTYAKQSGLNIAAHDLRRTYAKLAHKGGAALEQIQLSLGHASVTTTERYLGIEQDLQDAPGDRLGIRLE